MFLKDQLIFEDFHSVSLETVNQLSNP